MINYNVKKIDIEKYKSDYNVFQTEGQVFVEEYNRVIRETNRDELILKALPEFSLKSVYILHRLMESLYEHILTKNEDKYTFDLDYITDRYANIERDYLINMKTFGIDTIKCWDLVYYFYKGNLDTFGKFIKRLEDEK